MSADGISPEPSAPPQYLTVNQVAALLQVSERTIHRWVQADPTLPALRIGGVLRFNRERLAKWLAQRESGRRGRLQVLGERQERPA